MYRDVKTVDAYLLDVPLDQKEVVIRLIESVRLKFRDSVEEVISSGMINYVIPLKDYPDGYHATPKEALPFISIAAQKHHVALYHMGLVASQEMTLWFKTTYENQIGKKADMGKSCIRFKKSAQIPYQLLEQLFDRMDAKTWISIYHEFKQNMNL